MVNFTFDQDHFYYIKKLFYLNLVSNMNVLISKIKIFVVRKNQTYKNYTKKSQFKNKGYSVFSYLKHTVYYYKKKTKICKK